MLSCRKYMNSDVNKYTKVSPEIRAQNRLVYVSDQE